MPGRVISAHLIIRKTYRAEQELLCKISVS